MGSMLKLPDPDAPRLPGERRRTVRQRLHTPVYVSFNTPQSGAVVDLSELLDLHENGFAVQTALPTSLPKAALNGSDHLEVNRAVTMCLDLPETRKFVHASGQVMWTDDTGRAGIRFSFLPDTSRQVLKEWLFANLLVASTNHSARTSQLAHQQQELRAGELLTAESRQTEQQPDLTPIQTPSLANKSGDADSARARLLSALDDVRRQIRQIETAAIDCHVRANSEAILQLITDRAASLTGASGAALAYLTNGETVCRTRVGEPAPPVGSEVDSKNGLSGECLRAGTIVWCTDTEADPRVDPEICRMFGIGSFMAAPIFADFRVVGLIEVFSPYPHTFIELHEAVLERLAEFVPSPQTEQISGEMFEARENGLISHLEVAATEVAETEQIAHRPHEKAESEQSTTRQTAAERNAILEQIFEGASQQTLEQISDQGSDRPSEESSDNVAEPSPTSARRFPFSHLVLLVLTIAVAAMALGYLLAPTIEEHLLHRAQAAERSASPPQTVLDRRASAPSPDDLRKLAEQGDPDAQWQLGILYHDGDKVPKDDALAVQWFERAAEKGYVRAQSTLGAYYWAGRGVPPDLSKAYFWSQLALAQGDENSKSRLEGLSAQMTRAQVTSARQQAEAWLRAHNQSANSKPN